MGLSVCRPCTAAARACFHSISFVIVVIGFAWVLAETPALAQQTEADVFVAQAILEYEDKHYDDALRLLHEALDIDPNNVDALYYTGLTFVAQQKPAQAIPVFEKAFILDPVNSAVQYQLGVAYFNRQDYEKAAPLLTEVFTKEPKKENLGYYVGFMRYRNKNYQ
jgi:cytochrome c-type biogenesis protein CcmH/NrfG